MNKQHRKDDANQSARFIEAAKQVGADESGKTFERAFRKIVKPKKTKRARSSPRP